MFTGTIMNSNFDIFMPILPSIAILYALLCLGKYRYSEILLYAKRNTEKREISCPCSRKTHRISALFFSMILPILALCASLQKTAYAETTKGYCGDPNEDSGMNLVWSFDASNGTLTISGEGRMQESTYPWDSLSGTAKYVVISRGVTSIGPKAFAGFTELSSIDIPESVIFIGQGAFENSGVKDITIDLVLAGASVVLDKNIFTGTRAERATIKVPGYHDVFFIINPDNTGYSIIEISYGSSLPDTDDTLLGWTSQTNRAELSASRGTPNTYHVIFDKNASDATGIMYPQTFTYDKAQTLDENQFTRSGYTFSGWAVEAKGDVVYADKAEVKNLTAIQDGTVLLYAKWEKSVSSSGLDFFRLCSDCVLPATGFSSLHPTILSAQPKELSYNPAGMRMMIPSLGVDMELVTVPLNDSSWPVEWLEGRGGILENSALPGEGYSFVAAHNTLDDTKYGPFAMLGSLEVNDLITVTGVDNTLQTFRVFDNTILAPGDMKAITEIAGREENSLILITCENESPEGGYLNRRVIFAKPGF